MAKNYKVGEIYYLPVTVYVDKSDDGGDFPIGIKYNDGKVEIRDYIQDTPGLLLTAEDIATVINTEREDALEELKARNAELEALLKEVTATRDEAIRQINELLAENSKLKVGADKLKDTLVDRTKDVQHYKEENDRLKKALEERAENVMNLLEENDKLKAERDKFSKTAKDKADLANKACDERYDAQVDLVTARAAIDHLQEENKKLKQELKDAEQISSDAIATSNNRKYQISIIEEVIVALVEKIRRLEGGET